MPRLWLNRPNWKVTTNQVRKFRNKWAVYRHLRLRLRAAGNRLRVGAEQVTPSPTDDNTAMSATYREQRGERMESEPQRRQPQRMEH